MKNKSTQTLLILFFTPVVFLIVLYLLVTVYYMNVFPAGIIINGHYCTGLSTKQVDALLQKDGENYSFTIHSADKEDETVFAEDIDYQCSFQEQLNALLENQHPILWGYYLLAHQNVDLDGKVSFDHQKVIDFVKSSSTYQDAVQRKNPTVKIVKTDDGYVLRDDTIHAIDTEILVNEALKRVALAERQMDTTEAVFEKKYQESANMKETKALFEKIDSAQSVLIKYCMDGSELTIGKNEIAGFLETDQKGNFVLDDLGDLTISQNAVYNYTQKISDTFDTAYKDRSFQKTDGGTVFVNSGEYGFTVDRDAETNQIVSSVLYGISQSREPFPQITNLDIGDGKIGDTYIEVDMSKQMLYYYVDGELFLETDVVTGAVKRGRGTPQKICYVYAKQKNRTLKGANYSAFVNFWMPVSGNIGLHDAKWRKEFGGEIYKNSGSHGCINLPKEAAEKIYDQVTIGTPVIMYY